MFILGFRQTVLLCAKRGNLRVDTESPLAGPIGHPGSACLLCHGPRGARSLLAAYFQGLSDPLYKMHWVFCTYVIIPLLLRIEVEQMSPPPAKQRDTALHLFGQGGWCTCPIYAMPA